MLFYDYLAVFAAAAALACGVILGAFVAVMILKRMDSRPERRRERKARKNRRRAAGDEKRHGNKSAGAGSRRAPGRPGETEEGSAYVPLRDRMVDRSDSMSKFNCAADEIDEREYIEKRRSSQDKAYSYVKKHAGKEDGQ